MLTDDEGVPYGGTDLDEYLAKLSEGELAGLKLDTLERINAIRTQIEEARAKRHVTGEFADPEWYRRANSARRTLGYRITCIGNEERRRKDVRRRENKAKGVTWERAFIDAVRQTVPPAQYQQLVKMTDSIVHNERLEADRGEVRKLNGGVK